MEKINLKLVSASILLLLTSSLVVYGQIPTGIYTDTVQNNGSKTVHQVKINGDYFIYNEYEVDPAKFIKTVGGFFKIENNSSQNTLVVQLEFNSDYEKDALKQLTIPFKIDGENLQLHWSQKLALKPTTPAAQDLDGAWFFATR